MDACCGDKAGALEALRGRQAKTLRIALVLNALMFAVELGAGLVAGSVALVADSLDMLGDALVYAFSLYVVGQDAIWKARAAHAKAGVMALFGVFVAGQLSYKLMVPTLPHVEIMSAVGALALAVNAVCFAMLWRYRGDDINMRSVWLCSRNDLIANGAVLAAAGAVLLTQSHWPDLVVGAAICLLFLQSAWSVAGEAWAIRRPEHATATRS